MFYYKGLYVDDYNKELYLENTKRTLLKEGKPSVLEIENGIILPAHPIDGIPWGGGGVLREDYSFVEESKIPRIFGGKYDFSMPPKEVDQTVIYMGPFLCHWGHFICDQISRLWYILSSTNNYNVAYCGWNWGNPQTSLWGNYLEFMHILGLKDSQLLDIQEPTKFRKVIIPEISFYRDTYYYQEFLDIFHCISSKVKKEDFDFFDNIYFSRRKFSGAIEKERGEDELEMFFEANGYKVMEPELLPLKQQIYYYKYAKSIAAISGSITHSILFARKDLNIIILNKMNLTNGYQMVVDGLVKANITYVDVYQSKEPVCFGLGPFIVGITSSLKQYAKDNNMVIPKLNAKYMLRRGSNFRWYNTKYNEIYSNPINRRELESQNSAVEALHRKREEKLIR